MFRSGLVAIALLALLGTARAADDGCEKFAWSLAGERAAFTAPDKTTVAAGETLPALPAGALVIRLQQGTQASFEMPPERKPRTEQWHGGMVRLPALAKSGIYQITLSDDAWIDVIQNGRYARSVGSTGRSDCPGVRKSVRLEFDASPAVLQVSGVAGRGIRSPLRSARCSSVCAASKAVRKRRLGEVEPECREFRRSSL